MPARYLFPHYGTLNPITYFSAIGDGRANDTGAIQDALDTGRNVCLPAGTYHVTDQLVCRTSGQIISGDGKGRTIIKVGPDFNMHARGVFAITGTLPGPEFRDFQINFMQPDTSDLSRIIRYPAAFNAVDQARTIWERVKVNAAWLGIDLRGNPGGSTVSLCELSAFNIHIAIDGAQDSIIIEKTRFENDALTPAQSLIYRSAACVGISSGRCDDLKLSDCLLICGTQLSLFTGALGNTFGQLSNVNFDTCNGLVMDGGDIVISSSQFSTLASFFPINIHAGYLTLAACRFLKGATQATPMISVGSGALLTMTGCRIFGGDGTGQGLSVAADGLHNITGNCFGGWQTSLPQPRSLMVFANNN